MHKFLLIAMLLIPCLAPAQGTQKYLIKAGKLFDSETGQFKANMNVLVNNDRIEAVKSDNLVSVAERNTYQLIDLSAYALLPGLIDAHTHLLFKERLIPGIDFSAESLEKTLTMEGDAYRAIYGSVRAKAYLESGITAVQDLGNSGKFADIALRKTIEEGLISGPRMRCAGQGISSEGGQLPGLIYKHRSIADDEYRIVSGVDDARQAVRENITQGANVIKIYSNNTPNRTALSVEEMKAIVKEAHRYGLRVTAPATDNQAVYNAVVAGVDGIEHGYEVADSTLVLMAKRKVILVPTDGDKATFLSMAKIAYPNDKDVEMHIMRARNFFAARLKRALKAGVTIAFGSDDYIDSKLPFAEPSKRTIIGYTESGASISQALQFATINAAKQLNWSGDIGVLRKGFFADMIAVDTSVDKDINVILNVHFVMKVGVIVRK